MTRSPTSADSHEIRGLTGIRGFAAILVVVFHFYSSWVLLFPDLAWAERPISHGYLGVDLFFILSGFILCYVYQVGNRKLTASEYGQFLLFRLARIYPNHLATLLLLIFIVLAGSHLGFTLTGLYPFDNLPYQVTMTQSWPIDPRQSGGTWNFPAWSISAEWFAYLAVFPTVAYLLRQIRSSALALVLGTCALILWQIFYLLLPDRLQHAAYHGLTRVTCEFFAGGMFFGAFLLGSTVIRFCQRYLSGLFVVLLVLSFGTDSFWTVNGILLIFPLLLLGLTAEVSLMARLLSTRPALWLGRVSYALYMSHGIATKFVKVLLPTAHYVHFSLWVRLLVVVAHLMIIFAMTVMLYYLVEIPARNYLRKTWAPWISRDGRSSTSASS